MSIPNEGAPWVSIPNEGAPWVSIPLITPQSEIISLSNMVMLNFYRYCDKQLQIMFDTLNKYVRPSLCLNDLHRTKPAPGEGGFSGVVAMSNTVVVKVISASVRKVFAAQKFESIISGLVRHADDVQITPSMVSMTKAGAVAAMGGKATPQSFVNGLLFAVSAHAYGQKLPDGLPAHAVVALNHAMSMIKKGAGIDARTLKLCAMSCMDKVLAMPTKSEQAAIEEGLKPVIDGEFKVIPAVPVVAEIDDVLAYGSPMENTASERAYVKAMRLESLAAKELAAQQAEVEGHAAQSAMAKSEAVDFVELFDKLAADHADQAEEMLRTMAAHLGYRLTKIPAKKAA